jgi:hypothetical protein
LRSEIERLHNKFVFATIEHELANFSELAFDDSVMLARNHFACEHGSGRELPGTSIELHADIGRNHRAKNGDSVLVVDAEKHKEQ